MQLRQLATIKEGRPTLIKSFKSVSKPISNNKIATQLQQEGGKNDNQLRHKVVLIQLFLTKLPPISSPKTSGCLYFTNNELTILLRKKMLAKAMKKAS